VGEGGGIAGNVYINGNVGIGTATPSNGILDVSGTLRVGSGTGGLINLGRAGVGGYRSGYINSTSTDLYILNQQPGAFQFGTNNDEKMRILTNGNVGIGTATPNAKLDVNGTVNTSDKIDCGGRINVNGDVAQTSGGLSYMVLSRNSGGNSSFINWYTANGTRLGFMGNGPISSNVGTGDMQLYFENGTTGLIITGDTDKKLTVKGPIGFSYTTVPTFTTSQIGYTYSNAITGNIVSAGGVISTISTPPRGVWNIGFFIGINAGAPTGYYQVTAGTTSGGSDIFGLYFQQYNGGYQSSSLSVPFTITSTSSFYLWASSPGATYSIYSGRFYAMRIA
jgi:hypothetical protein